jgi:hypothetical protein
MIVVDVRMVEKAANRADDGWVRAQALVVTQCFRLLLMLYRTSALHSLDTRDTMDRPIDVHVPDRGREYQRKELGIAQSRPGFTISYSSTPIDPHMVTTLEPKVVVQPRPE